MLREIPDLNTLLDEGINVFKKEFRCFPKYIGCAPGRVNLIGEHTDYNDGFVLPMALPLVSLVIGRKIDGNTSTVITTEKHADEPHKTSIDMPSKQTFAALMPGTPKWANYVKGVIANFIYNDVIPAFEAVIVSTVPLGGGLSSSASLEVAVYTFLEALTESSNTSPVFKALACQQAEHNFANVPCGIMDQFISLMGKENHALLIDCRSNATTHIPLSDPNILILITDSNVKHDLKTCEYSVRRSQCFEAAKILNIPSLRDATLEDIEKLEKLNINPLIIKRAKHVVTEIKRTNDAAYALQGKDYIKFGKLMSESHNSLRDDYDVSCSELNEIVNAALEVKGVLGSRMTGGGFGGCTVSLVYAEAIEKAMENIKLKYKGSPVFYVCAASEGAQIISVKKCMCKRPCSEDYSTCCQ